MFNRKTGNNSGTQEGGNQVLVTSAGAEGSGYAASTLLAKLSAGGSHTVNVDGTNVKIVVNSINLSVTPAVADVTIGDGTPQPTQKPTTSAPSKSPTSRPTLPPGSTVLLACGSTAGSCRQSATNDPTRVANLNESHEVRCCVESSTNPGGWSKHSSGSCAAAGFTSTWGESDIPGCVHSATYDEAETFVPMQVGVFVQLQSFLQTVLEVLDVLMITITFGLQLLKLHQLNRQQNPQAIRPRRAHHQVQLPVLLRRVQLLNQLLVLPRLNLQKHLVNRQKQICPRELQAKLRQLIRPQVVQSRRQQHRVRAGRRQGAQARRLPCHLRQGQQLPILQQPM